MREIAVFVRGGDPHPAHPSMGVSFPSNLVDPFALILLPPPLFGSPDQTDTVMASTSSIPLPSPCCPLRLP